MAEQTQQTDADKPQQDKGKSDADKQADKGKQAAADQPKKLELTEEELQTRINAALTADRNAAAEKVRKDREKAEADAAREQGKFKELAEKAEAERDAERLKVKQADARLALRDYLGEDDKRRLYLTSAAWIEKAVDVTADTDAADVPKLVKTAADQFIKDNPREAPKPGPGGGALGKAGVRERAGAVAEAKEKKGHNHETDTVAASRF